MAPVPRPTPAALDQQAAKLREQAAGLSREMADRGERVAADFGGRIDDARRAAAAARAAAESATTQAKEAHDQAKEVMEQAKRFEADAARAAAEKSPVADGVADDLREQAQLYRANAAAQSRRAERAEQVARQQFDDAERSDREATRAERARSDGLNEARQLHQAVQKLEEKAFGLEQAASDLRTADTTTDPAQRDRLVERADVMLTAADNVKPDYSRVDIEAMVAAGIPVSDKPGAELMNPSDLDPVSPRPVDLHDTDLMDPDADPVLGPGTSGLDDGGIMDPSAPAPVSDVSDVSGAPGASDPLDDAGDLGFALVDAPVAPAPVAEAEASFGPDTSMDQPDVGSTSSYDGDGYGDATDELADEYIA